MKLVYDELVLFFTEHVMIQDGVYSDEGREYESWELCKCGVKCQYHSEHLVSALLEEEARRGDSPNMQYLKGISDFVNESIARSRKHSGDANMEDVALAVGWFGVPLGMMYGAEVTRLSDLENDFAIAQIVRYQEARQNGEGPGRL